MGQDRRECEERITCALLLVPGLE